MCLLCLFREGVGGKREQERAIERARERTRARERESASERGRESEREPVFLFSVSCMQSSDLVSISLFPLFPTWSFPGPSLVPSCSLPVPSLFPLSPARPPTHPPTLALPSFLPPARVTACASVGRRSRRRKRMPKKSSSDTL